MEKLTLKEWLTDWVRTDKALRTTVKELPRRRQMKFLIAVIAKSLRVGLLASIVPSIMAFVVIVPDMVFNLGWPVLPIVSALLVVGIVTLFFVSLRECHPREMAKLLETIE